MHFCLLACILPCIAFKVLGVISPSCLCMLVDFVLLSHGCPVPLRSLWGRSEFAFEFALKVALRLLSGRCKVETRLLLAAPHLLLAGWLQEVSSGIEEQKVKASRTAGL